jgi:hypothetical protein
MMKAKDQTTERIVAERFPKGDTAEKIALDLNLTISAINYHINKLKLRKPIDRSRPCTICGIVFVPKYSDGVKKNKYKTCSVECYSAFLSKSRTKYSEDDIQKVKDLKSRGVENFLISKQTGVDINKVKEIVRKNNLFLDTAVKTKNSQKGKALKNPDHMSHMRSGHMELSEEQFYKKIKLIEKDIELGLGTASGLAVKYGLVPASVVAVLNRQGKKSLLNVKESTGQVGVKEFLESIGLKVSYNDRKAIKPKEIDIYVESKKIGIEYCGIYWHSDLFIDDNTHLDKMKMANAAGIRLITIFEDEWLNRQDQVKNFLKATLGVSDRKLHGRKCTVKIIPALVGKTFMENYHIQGAAIRSMVYLGLWHEDELVGVMSLGRHHRRSANGEVVLDRLCFKDGVTVSGGSSKLLCVAIGWAKKQGFTKMVSWSDNRWSQGDVYRACGFKLEEELRRDYSYVKQAGRVSKQSCTKAALARLGAVGATEKEMAESLGYARIWDCGKKRWVLEIEQ